MAVTDPIPEKVEVSSSPGIANRSNRRATLDIRAIAYECELCWRRRTPGFVRCRALFDPYMS
ncbi:hypothetical protein E4U09_002394 [Claviceps aff. purpurea]|uniref:Uncharacterized protein n=1 Tax=Claviceps aff. purpurea TaxID=1967640 RepID=A0A9P7QI09_9HYPO|nr:hypothetical protein E4U09_002394 [Claviceps aff. purpurea]